MRRPWAIAVVAVLAIAGAWLVWGPRAGSEAPKYRTAAIERGPIEAVVSATGTVRPVVQVEVGSQVSGTVYRIHVDYNARVRTGQVLCEIEPSALRARVVQNEAAVVKAEVGVKDAARVLARSRELVKQNYVSQAEVEANEVALEQRQAEVRQARAQLQVAEVDLKNSVIRAPIDGVVVARSIDLGQTVAASLQSPKLFVIANDLSQMQVETRIDEADIGRIRPGLPATFSVDAYPDVAFHGEVAQVRLEPITDQGVVTYTTVIRTGNPGMRLKPGMTANVSVQTDKRDDVLKLPSAALRFRLPSPEGRGGALASMRAGGAAGGAGRRSGGGASAGGGDRALAATLPEGSSRPTRAGADPPGRAGEGSTRRAGGAPAGRGSGARGMAGQEAGAGFDAPALKPGVVYVLKNGKPERVAVTTGLSDGTFVEVESDGLHAGDLVVVGTQTTTRDANLQPPPGMGGPFGRGGRR